MSTGTTEALTLASSTLVGDIGGTNARFAFFAAGRIEHRRAYLCADFPCAEDAIEAYLADVGVSSRPARVSLAVAGPVLDGTIRMTNNGWRLSERDLRSAGFEQACLVNDFAALAIAIPCFAAADLTVLGASRDSPAGATYLVLGPGTGFGVAALVREGRKHVVATTEGGHIAFAPADDEEIEILKLLRREHGRVSVERVLSGPGLAALHRALETIAGRVPEPLTPAEITERARAGDSSCLRATSRFCAILGAVAGDFALALGARGGVYIAGGVAGKLADLLVASAFRQRFSDKGRFASYNEAIPTWLLHSADAALIGAAHSLDE